MPRRQVTYSDNFEGQADSGIRSILCMSDDDSGENLRRARRILLRAVENELTPRQKEILTLYYFKNYDTVQIAKMLGISHQSVSVSLRRSRLRLYRCMKYIL